MSPAGEHEPRRWKVKKKDGSRLEPANLDVLRNWVGTGQIDPDDLVINDDLADWIRASEVIELFDLFEKEKGGRAHPATGKAPEGEDEIEVPDCVYHPGAKATEICVGCGKFICEECRERLEGKVYCRRCSAEKQAGAEPGAPAGPGARVISRQLPSEPAHSRLAIASLVFAVVAVIASSALILPRFMIAAAPAVGLVSFIAILSGGLALNRIRMGGGALRGRQFALAGLIAGCVVLAASVAVLVTFTGGEPSDLRNQPQRRQPPPVFSRRSAEERERNAEQLLQQVRNYLGEGKLEQAVSTSRTLLGLYPDTESGKFIEERLPALEQLLAARKAEEEERKRQNEQLARQRLEHALKMYAEGSQVTALDLLNGVVQDYSETDAAGEARVEIEKIEKLVADRRLKERDKEASRLAEQAYREMESERYDEAAKLYGEILSRYSDTPTAMAVRPKLKEAELLASDPSEVAFRAAQKKLPVLTYEESVALLREFLAKYPLSDRVEDAEALLDENKNHKSIADSLYNFGRTYFEEQKYNIAVGRYDRLIDEHPRSRWIPQAKKEYEETLEKLRQ